MPAAVAAVVASEVVVADFTGVPFAPVAVTAAARLRFEALVVALSQCAAVATVTAATGIADPTVRRRSALLLSALLRQGPIITAVAAGTMPTAIGFARVTTNPVEETVRR